MFRIGQALTLILASALSLGACNRAVEPGDPAPAPPVPDTPAAKTSAPVAEVSTGFDCGETRVSFGIEGDGAVLTIGNERFRMRNVVSASGAKYQVDDDPDTVFWSRGATAMLSVRGEPFPECVAVGTGPVSRLQSGEWVVEDIAGGGIIDRSRVTLIFTADDHISAPTTSAR